jgi:lipoprotein-releasing system permease protein
VYQALLTRKYLTSKIMPLLAAVAVMLCTAMVLTVWSVMGGFLSRLLESGRSLVGDVTIEWPNTGFAHYDELIDLLEEHPRVKAATPMIDTFGLVSLPDNRVEGVNIRGIDPKTYGEVVDYTQALWWKPLDKPAEKDHKGEDVRLDPRYKELFEAVYQEGLSLSEPDSKTGVPQWAAVPGIEMLGLSKREASGIYRLGSLGKALPDGGVANVMTPAFQQRITVRVVPFDREGRDVRLVSRPFAVANEFRTGVFEIDRRTIYIPLAAAQSMMKMEEAKSAVSGGTPAAGGAFNPYDLNADGTPAVPVITGIDPARVTTVLVRAKDGVSPDELREACDQVYETFAEKHRDVPAARTLRENNLIRTWEMRQAQFVAAVRKETSLVLFILGFVSATASFLILAIFWAMISEKTKDIGVLRSLGASRAGIAWLWIRYGLAIGVVGSLAGGALAWLVVSNINPIHDWMGSVLGVTVWDPRVYYFTTIPNTIEPVRAVIVLISGLVFSLLGAIIPAIRAATLDPVRALRFE